MVSGAPAFQATGGFGLHGAALTPIVTEVFQVSHFNLVLQVFPDVAAAVAHLSDA
jgi:hypothetical protein